jgi:2-keto-3-deoxy-6-phosphogluconate aldolase
MKREEVCALIKEIGILPSVRVASQDLAFFAAETVYAAGIPIVEITLDCAGSVGGSQGPGEAFPEVGRWRRHRA